MGGGIVTAPCGKNCEAQHENGFSRRISTFYLACVGRRERRRSVCSLRQRTSNTGRHDLRTRMSMGLCTVSKRPDREGEGHANMYSRSNNNAPSARGCYEISRKSTPTHCIFLPARWWDWRSLRHILVQNQIKTLPTGDDLMRSFFPLGIKKSFPVRLGIQVCDPPSCAKIHAKRRSIVRPIVRPAPNEARNAPANSKRCENKWSE